MFWRAILGGKFYFFECVQVRFYDHYELLYNMYTELFVLRPLKKKVQNAGQNRIKCHVLSIMKTVFAEWIWFLQTSTMHISAVGFYDDIAHLAVVNAKNSFPLPAKNSRQI
jgi:hypothetical protein